MGAVTKKSTTTPDGAGPYRARFSRGINGTNPILDTPFPQIAFVGRSNVGKSSTINALLGVATLARTSGTPGKTQEINFFMVNDNMFFVDLPGYGFARMPEKEREAIRKHIVWYLSGKEARPKLVVLIIDAKVGLTEHDKDLLSVARDEDHSLLILLNKSDKLNQSERVKAMREVALSAPGIPAMLFSAKEKTGVNEVREIIFLR